MIATLPSLRHPLVLRVRRLPARKLTLNTEHIKSNRVYFYCSYMGIVLSYPIIRILVTSLVWVRAVPIGNVSVTHVLMFMLYSGNPEGFKPPHDIRFFIIILFQALTDSKSPVKLIYATPEKLAKSKRFMSKLQKAYSLGLLARIAIDEVHCCSQWGHDFRPGAHSLAF